MSDYDQLSTMDFLPEPADPALHGKQSRHERS